MTWLERWSRERADESTADSPESAFQHETLDTHLEMASALTFALELRNRQRGFVEHCTRVTRLAAQLAHELGVEGEALRSLRYAAQLHEIGMIAVPTDLLKRPAPLSAAELRRVRSQAAVGAEIARATHEAKTARLIEHQYTDFEELRRHLPDGSGDLLLAGILRVADVCDTLRFPRPYQRNITAAHRVEVLRSGAGKRFHPAAIEALFETRDLLLDDAS